MNLLGLRPVLAVTLLAVVGTSFYSQGQPQNQPPRPARSRADETLAMWNSIGNKLIAMAQDFPEDKYDFKVQKDQRTFAQTLLHVAGVDYLLIRTVSGSNKSGGEKRLEIEFLYPELDACTPQLYIVRLESEGQLAPPKV
jgi:hypothetical protein